MLQLNFPSIQNVPKLPPSSIASSSQLPTAPILRLNNHRRRGQFTEKIVKHGGVQRDNTLFAASKQKLREKKHYEKNFTSMDDVVSHFEREKEEIEKLKAKIEHEQKIMAKTALKWYSALTIQLKWRSFVAKFKLFQLRSIRFLRDLFRFKLKYWRKKQAVKRIANKFRAYLSRRYYLNILRRMRAAKKIQKIFRKRMALVRLLKAIYRMSLTKKLINHIMLFGKTKAYRTIKDGPRENWKPHVFRSFMAACARRRRLRFLKSPQGKIAFYILSRFYVTEGPFPHNKVIEFIKKRVLYDDKSRRRGNLSMKQVTELKAKGTFMSKSPSSKSQGSPTQKSGGGGGTSLYGTSDKDQSVQQAALWTAQDLPIYFRGGFAPKTVMDVMILINDMYLIAKQHHSLLDDNIVPFHPSTVVGTASNKKIASRPREAYHQANMKQAMTMIKKGGGVGGKIAASHSGDEHHELSSAKNQGSTTSLNNSASSTPPTSSHHQRNPTGIQILKTKAPRKDTMNHPNHVPVLDASSSTTTTTSSNFVPTPPSLSKPPSEGGNNVIHPKSKFTRPNISRGSNNKSPDLIIEEGDEQDDEEGGDSPSSSSWKRTDSQTFSDEDSGLFSGNSNAFAIPKSIDNPVLPSMKPVEANVADDDNEKEKEKEKAVPSKPIGNNHARRTTSNSAGAAPGGFKQMVNRVRHTTTIDIHQNHPDNNINEHGLDSKTLSSVTANPQKPKDQPSAIDPHHGDALHFPSIRSPDPTPLVVPPIDHTKINERAIGDDKTHRPAQSTHKKTVIQSRGTQITAHPSNHQQSTPIKPPTSLDSTMSDDPLKLSLSLTSSSVFSNTLNYSESEDEATPFKLMKKTITPERFESIREEKTPTAIAPSSAEKKAKRKSTIAQSKKNSPDRMKVVENIPDQFEVGYLSGSDDALLDFPIPDDEMMDLLGTGFHLDPPEDKTKSLGKG